MTARRLRRVLRKAPEATGQLPRALPVTVAGHVVTPLATPGPYVAAFTHRAPAFDVPAAAPGGAAD